MENNPSPAKGVVHQGTRKQKYSSETRKSSSGGNKLRKGHISTGPTGAHGHFYEIHLVSLFLIRAIGAGYDFELTSNDESIGGKFDDVIFRYRTTDKETNSETWRYRYLQAKHKIDSSKKIKSSDLLDFDKGDFSLKKYFQSYSMIVAREDDIEDCIICTNIGFDLEKNEISLVEDRKDENILDFRGFPSNGKEPARYHLKFSNEKRNKLEEEWSDSYNLAEELKACATEKRITDPRKEIFKMYHVALVEENVIDLNTKQFHPDFINGLDKLSVGAKLLRKTLCELCELNGKETWKEWQFELNKEFGKSKQKEDDRQASCLSISPKDKLKEFLDKLVFVVNSPSQDELEDIFKNEISKYYPAAESKTQTPVIIGEITKWFNKKERELLTPVFGADILLKGVREFSDKEQKRLEEHSVNFRDEAINAMKTNLEEESKPYRSIASQCPDWTAFKVIRAIQAANDEESANQDDTQRRHWWLTRFEQLHEGKDLWRNRIELMEKIPGKHFVVVICDESSVGPELMKNIREGITMVIIGKPTGDDEWEDVIGFQDLDETTKAKLLARKINLQTTEIKLKCLIPPEGRDDVLDFLSIQELWNKEKNISMQSPVETSGYNKYLYIDRTSSFLFHGRVKDLNDKIQNEVKEQWDKVKPSDSTEFKTLVQIKEEGQIEWLTNDKNSKSKIWEIITKTMDEMSNRTTSDETYPEKEFEKPNRQRVIITGEAGSGKSQLLSHLYYEITKSDQSLATLKISLVDHVKAMQVLTTESNEVNQQTAINFFLNTCLDGQKSHFIRSLVKYRLGTGDRLFLFLDGFDEIDKAYQDALIKLLKELHRSVRVYITTRVHMARSLEYEFSQLAYELMNFHTKDQVEHLTKTWLKFHQPETTIASNKPKSALYNLAKALVRKVDESAELHDFIGIPLQCRILAETYEMKVGQVLNELNENSEEELSKRFLDSVKDDQFDRLSMYKNLMKTKKMIFSNEKTKIGQENDVVSNLLWKFSKRHLAKLAIRGIVLEENVTKILSKSFGKIKQSEEENLNRLAITYGIVSRRSETTDSDKLQFLHRTYAEYFVAKFVYNGFRLDDDHNDLLASKEVREWIVKHLFIDDNYNGVRIFLDCILEKKDLFAGWKDKNQEWKENIHNSYIKDFMNHQILSLKDYLNESIKEMMITGKTGDYLRTFIMSCCICFGYPLKVKCLLKDFLVVRKSHGVPDSWPVRWLELDSGVFERLLHFHHDSNVYELLDMATEILYMNLHFEGHVKVKRRENYDRNMATFLDFLKRIGPLFNKRNCKRFLTDHSGRISSENKRLINNITLYESFMVIMTECSFAFKLPDFDKFAHYEVTRHPGFQRALLASRPNLLLNFPNKFRSLCIDCDSPMNKIFGGAKDFWGITDLHEAAFYNDIAHFRNIHQNFLHPESTTTSDGLTLQSYIKILTEEENGFTPLYVAILRNHRQMCEEIIKFLQKLLKKEAISQVQIDEMCSDQNGCVYRAHEDITFYRPYRPIKLYWPFPDFDLNITLENIHGMESQVDVSELIEDNYPLKDLDLAEYCARQLSKLDMPLKLRTDRFFHAQSLEELELFNARNNSPTTTKWTSDQLVDLFKNHVEEMKKLNETSGQFYLEIMRWREVNRIFPLFLTSTILNMEKDQLQAFVDSILTVGREEKYMPFPSRSIWLDYVDQASFLFLIGKKHARIATVVRKIELQHFYRDTYANAISIFLRQVVERLGSKQMKTLVLGLSRKMDKDSAIYKAFAQMKTLVLGLSRKMDKDSAIYKAFARGNPYIIEALLSNFDDENKLKIREQLLSKALLSNFDDENKLKISEELLSNQQIMKNISGYYFDFIRNYAKWVEGELEYSIRVTEWLYIFNRLVGKLNKDKRNDILYKMAKLFFNRRIYFPGVGYYNCLAYWCLEEYLTDKVVLGGKKRFRKELKRFFNHFTEEDIKAVLNTKEIKFPLFLWQLEKRIKRFDLSQDEKIQQLVMAFNF